MRITEEKVKEAGTGGGWKLRRAGCGGERWRSKRTAWNHVKLGDSAW